VGSLRPDGRVVLAGTTPDVAPLGARPWVAVVDPDGPTLVTLRALPALAQEVYGGTQVSSVEALPDGVDALDVGGLAPGA